MSLANYTILSANKVYTGESAGTVIVHIRDQNKGKRSVTNDAEAVVAEINEKYPRCKIIYQDSMGEWGELLHENGEFTGFAPVKIDNDSYGDFCRDMREERRARRAAEGINCPECNIKQPKRIPTILLPQQRCKVCGYRDKRPRDMS